MIIAKINIYEVKNFKKLWDYIPVEYLSISLMEQFESCFSDDIKTLLIEYPYIDKDYRSTYYAFYAKRHRSYDQFCFRIHLFSKDIQVDELHNKAKYYLGSIVLRPTEITSMGRTLLSPKSIRDFSGYICETQFENNILGVPFTISTFPHIMQDSDVTICAHAVCWMIARYYSEKYTVYPERLTYDIVEAVKDISFGRNIPSHGLTLGQVSEVLTSIGFFPEIFARELYDNTDFFYDILYSYVESGIPIVAAMRNKEHAISIIGHGNIAKAMDFKNKEHRLSFIPTRLLINSLIVNDDNCLPFKKINFSNNEKYNINDIDAFVVPLYEKMYLNAENVLKFYPFIVKNSFLSIPKDTLVARVYMTSSKSYKREIHSHKNLPLNMLKAQLELPMPKFVWIIELSTPVQYDLQMVDYRWIIDSTANQYETMPFIFIHDKKKMIINDRAFAQQIFEYDFKDIIKPYTLYTNNLKRRLV